MRKVEPLSKALRGYSAWVTGIRRVEAPTRANAPLISWDKAFGLVKINPIAAWTDEDMQNYIDANGVLVNPLVDEGYPSIGCAPCTAKPALGADPRSGRWAGKLQDRMRAARVVSTLVLTAHGSADPRSAATARSIVDHIRRLRPGLDARVAFCEQNSPESASTCSPPCGAAARVVVPLLLADAYHARVDIPAMIDASGAAVCQAGVLGEDDRLIHVLRQRVEQAGVSRLDAGVGVLVTAVGSSRSQANARTTTVARELTVATRWTATTAFATGPQPSPGRCRRRAARARRLAADRRTVVPGTRPHHRPGRGVRARSPPADGGAAGRTPAGGRDGPGSLRRGQRSRSGVAHIHRA